MCVCVYCSRGGSGAAMYEENSGEGAGDERAEVLARETAQRTHPARRHHFLPGHHRPGRHEGTG